jgi:hypothetical protein
MLRTNVSNGRIPAEVYEDKSRWPEPMRAEWGEDEGQTAAREHRARLLAGYRRLRAELDAFQPDLVVIWGDDQYENFKKDCVPPFCVYILDEAVCKPLAGNQRGPFRTPENAWGLPPDTELHIRGHREAANALTRALLAADFDPSYAYTTRDELGLAHSFANTILYLDYEWQGFPYPVVPFHVNCYGNQLMQTAAKLHGESPREMSPPAPSPRRCFAIGRATARFFATSPWRVALIASSSWSHGSLTPKHNRLYPDLAADRALADQLRDGRFAEWGAIPLSQIEECGQHEVLNWICLAGAMAELQQPAEVLDHVESHVFNSSKCFAVFRPPALVAPSREALSAAGRAGA